MSYIARGLFSVFVADMEMQCTPQALFLPFNKAMLINTYIILIILHKEFQLSENRGNFKTLQITLQSERGGACPLHHFPPPQRKNCLGIVGGVFSGQYFDLTFDLMSTCMAYTVVP
jgi:hypothetical protein